MRLSTSDMRRISDVSDKHMKSLSDNTYLKVVSTGHVLEVYEFEKLPRLPGKKRELRYKKYDDDFNADPKITRKQNMQKSRNNLRRLISANFDESSKFITLTFKDNLKCVKTANRHFKRFIQRLRRRYDNFGYATVIEFQLRGAVHYHMIANLPYISNSELSNVWGHGFVKINDISHVDNVGAYMIKYMGKDLNDTRLQGLKSYQTSRGLVKPVVLTGDAALSVITQYGLTSSNLTFHNSYNGEHLGYSTYKEYNLKRL